jgi:BlaI family transcriptional regulator, penicillinase repressor
MARRKQQTPTEGELEILQVLWQRGPSTVREVLEVLNQRRARAYTSVMSLLTIMVDKGFVERQPRGRAFVYQARRPREKTLGAIVGSMLGQAFSGAAHELVAHVLEQSKPTARELEEIRRTIEAYRQQEGR